MISRRSFSRLPVATAAAVVTTALGTAAEDDRGNLNRQSQNQQNNGIVGSWNTIMTFSVVPPAPIPQTFWILETFIQQGLYISIAALPWTTSAHGNWAVAAGNQIQTRSRMIVLPNLLGVQIKVEITELITIDYTNNNYTGSFEAVFTPDAGAAFTLAGTPTGGRIPPA